MYGTQDSGILLETCMMAHSDFLRVFLCACAFMYRIAEKKLVLVDRSMHVCMQFIH
jgi:hypothetical protein